MSIFKSAYDTTIGSSLVGIKKAIAAIDQSVIVDGLDGRSLNLRQDLSHIPLVITGLENSEAIIPAFLHPIVMTTTSGKKLVVVDMRSCFRSDFVQRDKRLVVSNRLQFNFTYNRLLNNLLMLTESIDIYEANSNVPALVYSDLISEAVSKRFALNAREQGEIKIIACTYFSSLFKETFVPSDSEKQLIAGGIAKQTKLPAAICFDTVERIIGFDKIGSMCDAIVDIVDNASIKTNFNSGILMSMLTQVWQGDGRQEMTPVATEHLPTWFSMVILGITERGYKSCKVADTAMRYIKGGSGGTEFAMRMMDNFERSLFEGKLEII